MNQSGQMQIVGIVLPIAVMVIVLTQVFLGLGYDTSGTYFAPNGTECHLLHTSSSGGLFGSHTEYDLKECSDGRTYNDLDSYSTVQLNVR